MEKRGIMIYERIILNIEGDEMKMATKVILITIISAMLIFNIPLYSKAALSLDDVMSAGDSFLEADKGGGVTAGTPDEGDLKDISNTVSGVLLTIALGVTLISGVMMGINFTIQSVEDKAKIKESMVPWIIGIIISFGAYGIWRITMNIFYQL